MKKINVFLPWNLPEYYASNGFHDLYDFILEENDFFQYKVIKTRKWYGKKILKFFTFFNKFDFKFRKSYHKSAGVSYFLAKTAANTCDLEFLHTSPIFAIKNKPFVFHLEDFQSIFLHRDILPVFKQSVNLKDIFEDKNCLAIISHIPETLESFRNYFNSPVINEKLHYNKIALSSKFVKSVNLQISKQKNDETVFLFTSSGHQHTNNYVTRGFKIVVNLAKTLVESGYKVKFIFKCVKLSRPDFLFLGLNDEQIDFLYNCPSIVWYEEYLSDEEMTALYQMSDFFLLPSAQLHSMSILKSMYCGAIPVVTDTVGTNQYVQHMENGIMLNGVREAVFNDKISLLKADIKNYLSLEENLTKQLCSSLIEIINNKELIKKLKRAANKSIVDNYHYKDNTILLLDYILAQYSKIKKTKKIKLISSIKKKLANIFLTSDFRRYKQITPQKVFEWEKTKLFKLHSYYFLTKNQECFCNIVNFPKPYKTVIEASRALRNIIFK